MKKKYIVSFSGGKDSTAMLLKMLENKEPIHSVLYFDTEREFPEIKEHIEQIKYLPIKFVTVRHWAGFDFLQQRYGKAHGSGGWCVAAKRDCCNKYMRLMLKDNPRLIECIGFSYDEKNRAKNIDKKWSVRFPLIEYKMTGKDALLYCKKKGYLFGGIYDWMPSQRVSCYDCPKKRKSDFEAIKKYHPELINV
jgi:hypothetical protein